MSRVVAVWSAAVVALTLVLYAIPMLLMDARANDGAASMTALFAFPLLATGALVELHRPATGTRGWLTRILPWVGALTVGMLLIGIAAMLLEPVYYEAQTQMGMFAVLLMFLLIIAIGAACGALFWALVILPIRSIAIWAGRRWRGEEAPHRGAAASGGLLAVEAVITVIVVATAERPDELVFAQLGAILLGLPLGRLAYEPPPEFAVWILRFLLVGILAAAGVLSAMWRGRTFGVDQSPSPDQSQTR